MSAADAIQIDELVVLLRELDREVDDSVPVVRIVLEGDEALDVFRAEQVRERPIVWRVRGFLGDIRPREIVALVLGTIDGRAILMAGPGNDAALEMNGRALVAATRSTRRLADLAELIARRVRGRFAPTDDG